MEQGAGEHCVRRAEFHLREELSGENRAAPLLATTQGTAAAVAQAVMAAPEEELEEEEEEEYEVRGVVTGRSRGSFSAPGAAMAAACGMQLRRECVHAADDAALAVGLL